MTVRRKRFLLWSFSLLLTAGSLTVISLGIVVPSDVESSSALLTTHSTQNTTSARQVPPLQTLEPLMALDLRRPLVDSPSPVVAQAPTPPLGIRLTGTVIEPGRNLAMLLTAEGKVEFKAVGESSGGAQILSIEQDRATILYNGETVTLNIEKAGQQG